MKIQVTVIHNYIIDPELIEDKKIKQTIYHGPNAKNHLEKANLLKALSCINQNAIEILDNNVKSAYIHEKGERK